MADLPDWYTQVQSATLRATSIQGGLDADKSASPVAEDVYLARDTGILYVCFVSGTWTNIGILYLLLAGGTMSGAIAMGSNKITGLAAPTASADAARKTDVDTVDAKLDDVTGAEPTRVLGTIYQNTGGKIRLVTITILLDDTEDVVVEMDSFTPPTTDIARMSNDNTARTSVIATFVVAPNYYYRAREIAAGGVLTEWHEWDLH